MQWVVFLSAAAWFLFVIFYPNERLLIRTVYALFVFTHIWYFFLR